MVNIESTRQSILEQVNLGQLLEQLSPQTMSGSQLKQKLVEQFNANRLNSVAALTEIIFECSKIAAADSAFLTFNESISEKLTDSIQAKLVYCVETVQSARPNTLTEQLVEKIETVLESKESDVILGSLRSGILKPFQSMPIVNFITESIKITTEEEASTDIHEAFQPVSYFEKDSTGNLFVRLHNKVLAINESNVTFVNSPSPKFAYLSSIVEAMQYDNANQTFKIAHKDLGQFEISEAAITRHINETTTICESAAEFLQQMSIIVESKDSTFSKLGKNEIYEQKQFVDSLISLKNNISNLAIADNIFMVENKKFHEKFAMILTEQFTYIATLKSNRKPLLLEKFNDVKSAVTRMSILSGYDTSHFVVEQLAVEAAANSEKAEQITEQQNIVEELTAQQKMIVAEIANEKRQPNCSEAVLAKLEEARQLNEAHIVEQRSILSDLLN